MKPFSNLKVLLKKIKLKFILIFTFVSDWQRVTDLFTADPFINQIYNTDSLTQNSKTQKLKLKLNAAVTFNTLANLLKL